MTPEEKIQELAEIVLRLLDSLIAVAPSNHQQYLEYLQQRAEELSNEG